MELPRNHLGLVRVLNNYTRMLGVLFGDECDHLVHVRAIRDDLEDNETDLESSTSFGGSIMMRGNFLQLVKAGTMGKSSHDLSWA